MVEGIGDSKAEKFEKISPFNQTLHKGVTVMREYVQKILLDLIGSSSYFSICLNKSTDNT